MNTPTINRTELRALIGQTPPPVRAALAATFEDGGYKKLSDDTWTNDELAELAGKLRATAEAAGYRLHVPLVVDDLRDRIAALPEDIADLAAVEASQVPPSGLPNVAHANRWTLEHWDAACAILDHAEELAATRLRHVHAALGQTTPPAGDPTGEDWRHMVVECITNGRTNSSRKLTGPEAAYLARWAEDCAVRGTDAVGPPNPYVSDWKAEAKRLGVTQGDLLKQAKEWAKTRRLEPPKKLEEVTDHRAIAALLATALDGRTAVTDVTEGTDVAQVVAEPVTVEPEPDPVPLAPAVERPPLDDAVAILAEVADVTVVTDGPHVDERELILDKLHPALVRHRLARIEYEAARVELITQLNALGAVGLQVGGPPPLDVVTQ